MNAVKDLFGWLGAVLFAICALPQVYTTWTSQSVNGMSFLFILMWFLGELFSAVYLVWDDIQKNTRHYPIYFNYGLNTACVTYLLYAVIKY